MEDRLQTALLFGVCWVVLALLIARLLFSGREHKGNLIVTRRNRRLRFNMQMAALVSAGVATVVNAFGPGEHKWFLSSLVGGLAGLLPGMISLITYDRDRPQDGPPMTGYRVTRQIDRDGPHT